MFHPIKNPRHYAGDGKISCKDALRSMMSKAVLQPEKAYWWGCAFKYLWRWPLKNGRSDLEKCKQCIDYMLELPDDVYPTVKLTEALQLTEENRCYIEKLAKQEEEVDGDDR